MPPWLFGFHPKRYAIGKYWCNNRKPMDIGNNILKYQRIDAAEREKLCGQWNEPVLWPLALIVVVLAAVVLPAVISYRRRERGTARGR